VGHHPERRRRGDAGRLELLPHVEPRHQQTQQEIVRSDKTGSLGFTMGVLGRRRRRGVPRCRWLPMARPA